MGVFSQHAEDYLAHGVVGLPTQGKAPLVQNPQGLGERAIRELLASQRFSDANIGFWCGSRNNLTIVDIDDSSNSTLERMVGLCGESPMIARTPSGNFHIYYRNNGERRMCRQLPKEDKIDILGKGICIAPPSIRPDRGDNSYEFIEGDLNDIDRLPEIKLGALPDNFYEHNELSARNKSDSRNDDLFHHLLKRAGRCNSEEQLVGIALDFNQRFETPLGDDEVFRAVKSAWNYKGTGNLWGGGEAHCYISSSEHADLSPDDLYLLMKLRMSHSARKGEFALANALGTSLGWTRPRYRKARNNLVGKNYVKITHSGGNRPKDPPRAILTPNR